MGCIDRDTASRWREGVIPLVPALTRLCMGYCTQVWCPQHKKDMDRLKWLGEEPPRWSGAGACDCEKSVRELGLLNLEKGTLGLIHGKNFPHEDRQAVEQIAQ